jgi:thiol:disulfide interchange protein
LRSKFRDDSKRADQARWGRLYQEGKTLWNPDRLVRHPIWLTIMLAGFLAMGVGSYFTLFVTTSSRTWGLVLIASCLIVGCMGSIWAADDMERWAAASEDEDTPSEDDYREV